MHFYSNGVDLMYDHVPLLVSGRSCLFEYIHKLWFGSYKLTEDTFEVYKLAVFVVVMTRVRCGPSLIHWKYWIIVIMQRKCSYLSYYYAFIPVTVTMYLL